MVSGLTPRLLSSVPTALPYMLQPDLTQYSYKLGAPTHLRNDGLDQPLGHGEIASVMEWQVPGLVQGAETSAYQVFCYTLDAGIGEALTIWDSGRVDVPFINRAIYEGASGLSRQRIFWKVRVWDDDGEVSPWSDVSFWELGLLKKTDWQASWISSRVCGGLQNTAPCPFFRKEISLARSIVSARLYASALGLYTCQINGQAVGDHCFSPGWTDYTKRAFYQTYDVTDHLRVGDNVIGAVLGDGWYCGFVGWMSRQFYGERPHFFAQVEVTYSDGTQEVFPTDESWRTTTGPFLEGDLLQGESYDACRELSGWENVSYDDSEWEKVQITVFPEVELIAPLGPPVRRQENLEAKILQHHVELPSGRTVYDFAQNFSGRIRLKVRGPRGALLKIRHAEILDDHGNLYTENLRAARATDFYTLKGGGVETYEPTFTFHGFRYAEIAWTASSPVKIECVEGIVLNSDMAVTGHFACSNPLINQLQSNIRWGQKSNFLEVPTDCPQRDERLGWTGDAQVFARTASFNMDVRSFFRRWLMNARDAQFANGNIPPVVPNPGTAFPNSLIPDRDAGPAWSDAVIICPWTIYLCYGDKHILEENYAMMSRFIGNMVAKSHNLIRCHPSVDDWGGCGDWLAQDGCKHIAGFTPKDLIGTAFLAYDAQLMAQIAEVIGLPDDVAYYQTLRENVCEAFCRRFVTREGIVSVGTQTAYLLALHFNLLPTDLRAAAARELCRDIEMQGHHLTTGFVGTPYLCQVLADHGHLDTAYKLLEQTTYPSWIYPVTTGATTIWERWDGWTEEKGFQEKSLNSFNHYAYGAVGAWMYATVAGLDLEEDGAGYHRIRFAPRPGGSITWAEATLETPFGTASIRWELSENKLQVAVQIPVNSSATFHSPKGWRSAAIPTRLKSGRHSFSLDKNVDPVLPERDLATI